MLHIVIAKTGEKIWKNIYSKSRNSKCDVSYLSNHSKPCLKNIVLFCLARHIFMILKKQNVKCMKLEELKTILKS